MARRRRQKNTMLPRIFAVAVALNGVAVMIAAQFGAFKNIEKQFGPSRVVLLAPAEAPKEKEKPTEKTKKPKAKPVRKAAGAQTKPSATAHPNLAQPKVETSTGDGAGASSGPVADAGGTLTPGTVPTGPPAGASTTQTATTLPAPAPAPVAETAHVAAPEPTPVVTPKHEPKYVDCEPITQPEPTIPDDLRVNDLSKDFVAEFVVGPNGVPISVKTAESTGIDELDQIALDAAKKWRFKPATVDGAPTNQTVRLTIQFRVE